MSPRNSSKIRDELIEQLDAVGHDAFEQVYLELRRTYSDIAISMREAREAFEDLPTVSTGSRIGNDPSSAVTIVEPRAGSSMSGDALIRRAQRRLQSHLDHITAKLGIDGIEAETVTWPTRRISKSR